jgi:hypothetical protein
LAQSSILSISTGLLNRVDVLDFGKNVENTPSTVWQRTWQFLATWEKPTCP